MASSDEASFLDEITQMLEATQPTEDMTAIAQDAAPLADDLSLLFLNVDADELVVTPAPPLRSQEQQDPRNDDASGQHAAPPSRSTVCRMRQREELEYLRGQVRELEDRVDDLQHAKQTRSPGAASSSSDDSGTESRDTAIESERTAAPAALWERIAKHQMSAKQKAEVENAKLREMLQGQLKIARGLERVLRKRSSLEVDIDAFASKRTKRDDSTGAAIYEQLKLGLDRRYRELTAAFEQNRLAMNRSDLEDVRVLSTGDASQLGVEILYSKVLPFDFATTSAAVWNCSSSSYLQLTKGFYAAEPASNDELTAKFEIPLTVRRQSLTLRVYVALRRYHESDTREAYAWESWSTVSSPQKSYDGIRLLDHGWTVIESLATNDPTSSPTTIVQSCSRVIPDESSLPRQSPIGVLSDVLIASYNRNYATLYETVENALLCTVLR